MVRQRRVRAVREITIADRPDRPRPAHMQDVGVQGQHRATLLPGQLQISGHSPTSNQDGRPAAMTTDLHVPAQTGTHHRLSRQWRLAAQIGYTYELLGQSPITLCKALGRNTQPHRHRHVGGAALS